MTEEAALGATRLNPLLRMAVMVGVESAVQIHIDRGDNLNARDASGMTPLMLSAARDKPAICKLLLSAGADIGLLDRSGKTALEIALDSGSQATAAVLNADIARTSSAKHPELVATPRVEAATDASMRHNPVAEAGVPAGHDSHVEPTWPSTPPRPVAREPAPPSVAIADPFDDGEFDLSGWDAEQELTRPEENLAVVDSASAIQIAITAHEPIDSSAEWDEIDAYLPDAALPLAHAEDVERRAGQRRLLLRAFREGSIPALDVQTQSTNDDRSANPEVEAYLSMVINDLGAEVDERFEYSGTDESFEVFVDPEETIEEEAALDEALAAIDRAASRRHEPLRIYQRDFQRIRRLTAEEDVWLAKNMEAALDRALDALASWPDGIARTLAAGADAIAGSRQLSSIWVGGEPESEPVSADGLEAGYSPAEDFEDAEEDDGKPRNAEHSDTGDASFANALRRLAVLTEAEDAPRASSLEIRQALAGLRINRRFLLELIDAAHGSAPCPAFARAMASFRQHRDRMMSANLKLAFFHAKKYLYSGEPLDDLAQEGNVGLLKAVDRYDWRRGFRFSTYATWWVRQQISRHVADKARTIRVPVHIFEMLQRADRIANVFETTTGREPTVAELAERVEMPSHKLAALLRIAPEPSSLEEEDIDGIIAIDDRDAYAPPDPADVVDKIQLNQAVDRYISSLSSKDRKEEHILRMRFGIGVGSALTLEEIGKRFEVTRERIRQIETKALRRLRHPGRSEPFARMALGLQPDERPLAHSTPEGDNVPDTAEPIRQPAQLRWQATPRPPREHAQPAGSSKHSALDQLLAKAIELGIPVNDERQSSGNIWVELLEPRDDRHRRLIRKLHDLGFAFWPAKGYWK